MTRARNLWKTLFPFLFGGTFIEAEQNKQAEAKAKDFPSFSEGLSLRLLLDVLVSSLSGDFPSFSEGLSLRQKHNN